jgi:TRAP transporter TAXI family solute receptor
MRSHTSRTRICKEDVSLRQSLTFTRAVFAIALLVSGGCRAAEKKPDLPVVRMATILGRIMNPLSAALAKVLPERFPARLEVKNITDSGEYPRLLENGEIELAMVQTNLAYAAYTQGLGNSPKPMRQLRGVAVLYATPLHLLATRSGGVKTVMDLRGKRISLGAEGSPHRIHGKDGSRRSGTVVRRCSHPPDHRCEPGEEHAGRRRSTPCFIGATILTP